MVLLKPTKTVTQGGSVHQCPPKKEDRMTLARAGRDADGKQLMERQKMKIPEK